MSLVQGKSRCKSRLSRGGGSSGFGMQRRRTEETEIMIGGGGGIGNFFCVYLK